MKKPLLRILFCILSIALLAGGLYIATICMVFGQLVPAKTIMQTLPSPNGTFEARVIDVDQGALGGNTVVEVKKVGSIAKPKLVYTGQWGEYETMEIYWKNDSCLVINGEEYSLDG